MTQTPKLKLNKPDFDDFADIAPLNENADRLDAAISQIELKKIDIDVAMPWSRTGNNSSEDPNTIDKPLISVKHPNAPDNVGWYWILSWKIVASTTRQDMVQIAIPYSGINALKRLYTRHRLNGDWTEWVDVAKRTVDQEIERLQFWESRAVQPDHWVSIPVQAGYRWRVHTSKWGVTPNDIAEVYFPLASKEEATRCGITHTETYENYFYVFAREKPTTALDMTYIIRRK